MKCSEIMAKDPVCCLPSDTVVRAAQLMKAENVGAIPVVANQQSKRLIGIVKPARTAEVVEEISKASATGS